MVPTEGPRPGAGAALPSCGIWFWQYWPLLLLTARILKLSQILQGSVNETVD